MDRLPAIALCLCLCAACGDSSSSSGAPPSRVVAVAATEDDLNREPFCEVSPAEPPRFELPELAEPAASAAGHSARPRWINVWATWCEPCVEEMPRIVRWRDQLEAGGHAVDLVFVSADTSDDVVAEFRREHPEVASTLRIAQPASLDAWAASLGLLAGVTLPLHVLVDNRGLVRCARAGAVSEDDYAALNDAVTAL